MFKVFIFICLILFVSQISATTQRVEVFDDHLYFTIPSGLSSLSFEVAGQDAHQQYKFDLSVSEGQELYVSAREMVRRDCRRAAVVYLDDAIVFVAPGGRLGEGYSNEIVCNGDQYNDDTGIITNLQTVPISTDTLTATYDPLETSYDLSKGVVSQIVFSYDGDAISDDWDITLPAGYQGIITDASKEYIVFSKDTVSRRDSTIYLNYNLKLTTDFIASDDRSSAFNEIVTSVTESLFNDTAFELLLITSDNVVFTDDFNVPGSYDSYDFKLHYESSSETDIVNFYNIASDLNSYVQAEIESALTSADKLYNGKSLESITVESFIIYANENRDGHENTDTYTSDDTYIVPQGIYEVSILSEGASASSKYFYRVQVQPYDEISMIFNGNSCNGVQINLNGEQLSYVPGTCGDLYLAGNTLSHSTTSASGSSSVSISYFDVCPVSYTNLHSDFNPILLPESSLYLVNNEPSLNLNFKLPNYYYDVEIDFSAYCNEQPAVTTESQYCDTIFKTAINYASKCPNLTLSVNPDDDSEYLYKGELIVSAKLKLDVDGTDVTREVISPINFQVTLARTIEISSDVELLNDHKCATEDDCNNEGCCEDGFCNCECADHNNGFTGDYCESDIQKPSCGAAFNQTISYTSPHGGCISLDGRNLIVARDYADNSGESSSSLLVDIDVNEPASILPGIGSDADYCFPLGTTTVTHNIADSSGNTNTAFIYCRNN